MARGRPRRRDPTIPAHIDQTKLPVGVYWDKRDRYWYTVNGKPQRRTRIAAGDAMMSELHSAMEAVRGVRTDTLDFMLQKFDDSAHYQALAETTRDGYRYSREALQKQPTKLGIPFSELPLSSVTMPLVQRLVDKIAKEHPTKANAIKRYLSIAFSWGMRRGHCATNPAKGVAQAKEKADHRMPEAQTMQQVLLLFRERGSMPSRRKGSVAPYIWAVAQLAYMCRMRGVEVRDLTDASLTDAGLMVRRRKGSRPTIVQWTTEMRDACRWLAERRDELWSRKRMPVPMRPEDRPLVVSEDGAPLTKGAMSSAWRRAMAIAMEEGLVMQEERFGIHGLKHRGITDTAGSSSDKQQASGHKSKAMVSHYDHEIPVVAPAKPRVKR